MSRPPLLYLTHRIPYPPNKGDKLRSFNILKRLAARYRVFLATFVDQEEDLQHVPALMQWCEDHFVARIHPRRERLLSLRGLLSGEALSLPYYRNQQLAEWVARRVAEKGIDRAVVFSGAMAQYLRGLPLSRQVIDFCDVDSAKWTQYADARMWPLSWLYRREGELLSRFEREQARGATVSTFVTEAERNLFLARASGTDMATAVIENGVDSEYFAPEAVGESPYPRGRQTVVFSGAMDYWPNVDAACWFAAEVLPRLRERCPSLVFAIVGMNPAPAVCAVAQPGVIEVTGTVPDVRPYVGHADVVVAPLRVARGIQNKVLEAMSLARPVVVSAASGGGLRARSGEEFVSAGGAEEFAHAVLGLLDRSRGDAIGAAARRRVLADYSWDAHLARLLALLDDAPELAGVSGGSR